MPSYTANQEQEITELVSFLKALHPKIQVPPLEDKSYGALEQWLAAAVKAQPIEQIMDDFNRLASQAFQQRQGIPPADTNLKNLSEFTLLHLLRTYGTQEQKKWVVASRDAEIAIHNVITKLLEPDMIAISPRRQEEFKEKSDLVAQMDGAELTNYALDFLTKQSIEQVQACYIKMNTENNAAESNQFLSIISKFGTNEQKVWADMLVFLRNNKNESSELKSFYDGLANFKDDDRHPSRNLFLTYVNEYGKPDQQQWAQEMMQNPENKYIFPMSFESLSSPRVEPDNVTLVTPRLFAIESKLNDPEELKVEMVNADVDADVVEDKVRFTNFLQTYFKAEAAKHFNLPIEERVRKVLDDCTIAKLVETYAVIGNAATAQEFLYVVKNCANEMKHQMLSDIPMPNAPDSAPIHKGRPLN